MSGGIRTNELLNCYHCGSTGCDLYQGLEDLMFGVPGQWSFLQCPSCGLAWLKNQPIVEDIPKLYESYYTHASVEPDNTFKKIVKIGIPVHDFAYNQALPHPRLLTAIAAKIGPLREIAAHSVMWQKAKTGGKLLDFGCGAGVDLFHLQQMGWQVFGTEPDPKAVEAARKLLNNDNVFEGFLEDAGFDENTFDALTSSHVLEHLFDPLTTLKECRRVMKPGAQLTFATPNIDSLASRHFKEYWRGLEIPRHLFLFSERSLREMAEKAGFRNIKILTPSCYAFYIWQGSYLLKTEHALPGGIPRNTGLGIKLRALFFWGMEFLRNHFGSPCGEELILIAEK